MLWFWIGDFVFIYTYDFTIFNPVALSYSVLISVLQSADKGFPLKVYLSF